MCNYKIIQSLQEAELIGRTIGVIPNSCVIDRVDSTKGYVKIIFN